jgi:hypothetical protein
MPRTWTARARGLVRADVASVAAWWMDERRVVEWQGSLEAHYGMNIEWRESADGESLTHEATWRTKKESQMRYWVTRHRPPPNPRHRSQEFRADLVSETITRDGRRSVTTGSSSVRMTSQGSGATEIVCEQSWRSEPDPVWTRIEWLDALRVRRQLKSRVRQCQSDLLGASAE